MSHSSLIQIEMPRRFLNEIRAVIRAGRGLDIPNFPIKLEDVIIQALTAYLSLVDNCLRGGRPVPPFVWTPLKRPRRYPRGKPMYPMYSVGEQRVRKALSGARTRALHGGWEVTVTPEEISVPEFCPYLGIKLDYNNGISDSKDSSPSLDRIDNSKGYVPGNVEIISYRANRVKNDGTAAEHQAIADRMRLLNKEP